MKYYLLLVLLSSEIYVLAETDRELQLKCETEEGISADECFNRAIHDAYQCCLVEGTEKGKSNKEKKCVFLENYHYLQLDNYVNGLKEANEYEDDVTAKCGSKYGSDSRSSSNYLHLSLLSFLIFI